MTKIWLSSLRFRSDKSILKDSGLDIELKLSNSLFSDNTTDFVININFTKEEGIKDALVCWSDELPIKTNDRTPGSAVFVPATAGLLISSHIILETIKDA